MKLLIEDDEGRQYEIKQAAEMQPGDVVLFANPCFRDETIKSMEDYISRRVGRKVIILDGRFRDIMTLPLFKDQQANLSRPTAENDLTHRSRVKGCGIWSITMRFCQRSSARKKWTVRRSIWRKLSGSRRR